jgi:hypothetical protein
MKKHRIIKRTYGGGHIAFIVQRRKYLVLWKDCDDHRYGTIAKAKRAMANINKQNLSEAIVKEEIVE